MDGILLVDGPSPRPVAVCPLGIRYLAASAAAAGIPVRLLQLERGHGPHVAQALSAEVAAVRPALVGLPLYTETALRTYEIVRELGPCPGLIRVAGGPHATACPEEALAGGFDVVVLGEGEETLVDLFQAIRRGTELGNVKGLAYRDASGSMRRTAARKLPQDLDRLPSPEQAPNMEGCMNDRSAESSSALPASLVTSRGCPGRCSFCSSFVSGRRYRFHSVKRVIADMRALHERKATSTFLFHDDAFTAHRPRLLELCSHIADLPFAASWLCEARADQLDDERAKAMARAGCTTVIVGVESGDPAVLRRIRKGITLETAERGIRAIRGAGMRTQVNFMFGFPGETAAEIDNSLSFMERIAPLADGLSAMGIVIPYPGTRLYQQHHRWYGFTRWWLDEARMAALHASALCTGQARIQTCEDAVSLHGEMERTIIEAGLIRYSKDVLRAIDRCLAFKREHNLRALQRMMRIPEPGLGKGHLVPI